MGVALLLSGGAPNMTFMAGGLCALDEKGVKFDVVSTSGAGMLIGLLYAAPSGQGSAHALRQSALRSSVDLYVDDRIFNFMNRVWRFPVNYKVFFKIGRMAEVYTRMAERLPQVRLPNKRTERFINDSIQFWQAAFCPTSLGPWSLGTCQPAPFVKNMVDFHKLKHFPGDFVMNAYCLETHIMELFRKKEITAGHFQAALAMLYIYAPYRLNGKTYIEGSAIDTICFKGVMEYLYQPDPNAPLETLPSGKVIPTCYIPRPDKPKIDTLVLFNMIGHESLIRKPNNLLDALGMQIITPLVALTKDDIEIFRNKYLPRFQKGNPDLRLLSVDVDLSREEWSHALDWSYKNGKRLFNRGYEAGLEFFERFKHRLLPQPTV